MLELGSTRDPTELALLNNMLVVDVTVRDVFCYGAGFFFCGGLAGQVVADGGEILAAVGAGYGDLEALEGEEALAGSADSQQRAAEAAGACAGEVVAERRGFSARRDTMLRVQSVDSPTARAAACLELRRSEVLAAYHDHLQRMASVLLDEEAMQREVMAHAVDALDEIIDRLRGDSAATHKNVLAAIIGASRAKSGVHPAESLQAGTAIFNVFVTAAAQCMNIAEDSAILSAAVIINQAIMSRIESAVSSYCDFLTDKIYCAHIEARHHLARELHDRVGTEVSVARRQLELYLMSSRSSPLAAENHIESLQVALVQAMDNIRQLALNLRLSEPGDGLDKTLRNYLETEDAEGVATEVIVNGDEDWMPPTVRDEVSLVVREALRNALYHGSPRSVAARISIAPHEVRAAVRDDGIGFRSDESAGAGSGILSMKERVALLGGFLRISSHVGHGTVVEFRIPLGAAQDDH